MPDISFERRLAGFGQLLLDNGPGILAFIVRALLLLPEHTDGFKVGKKLDEVFQHLPDAK